jgi:hypothetical protein
MVSAKVVVDEIRAPVLDRGGGPAPSILGDIVRMAVAELPDDVDALIVAFAEQRALLKARTSHLEVVNRRPTSGLRR